MNARSPVCRLNPVISNSLWLKTTKRNSGLTMCDYNPVRVNTIWGFDHNFLWGWLQFWVIPTRKINGNRVAGKTGHFKTAFYRHGRIIFSNFLNLCSSIRPWRWRARRNCYLRPVSFYPIWFCRLSTYVQSKSKPYYENCDTYRLSLSRFPKITRR